MEGKIGGDSALSERGERYAKAMPALITDNIGNAPLTVSTRGFYVVTHLTHMWYRCGRQLSSELSRRHSIYPSLS